MAAPANREEISTKAGISSILPDGKAAEPPSAALLDVAEPLADDVDEDDAPLALAVVAW